MSRRLWLQETTAAGQTVTQNQIHTPMVELSVRGGTACVSLFFLGGEEPRRQREGISKK